MPKFIIRVEKQNKLIDEVFESMELRGFEKARAKVFKAIFKSRINGLFILAKRSVSQYIVDSGDSFFEACIDNTDEIVMAERLKFEKFIYGDENTIKKEAEYVKFNSDRVIHKVMLYVKSRAMVAKDSAIHTALNGGSVLDFFNRCFISITWKVEP